MRARRRLKKKYRRFLAAAAVVAAAIAVTPKAIAVAAATRGYSAYGGEILIAPLALLVCWIVLDAMKEQGSLKENDKEKAAKQ